MDRISKLVIPASGQQFKSADLAALMQPGVYIIMDKETPLYIGMGKCLLRRVSSRHHKRYLFEQCTHLLLYPCVSIEAAHELETLLIGKLRPMSNANKLYTSKAKMLGLTSKTNLNRYLQN